MPKSFNPRSLNLSGLTGLMTSARWRDPRVFVRIILGALLLCDLIAAAFAFHLFGRSPSDIAQELVSTQRAVDEAHTHLNLSRQIAGKVGKARTEGDQFLVAYMTPRRSTFSTVLGELQQEAEAAGMTWKEAAFAPLEPIKGSDDLDMLTITASSEGAYANLLKFINLLDRSKRFLIIESLAATPQASGKTLTVTMKINTFVRGDTEGAL